jgi:hypothetical protein
MKYTKEEKYGIFVLFCFVLFVIIPALVCYWLAGLYQSIWLGLLPCFVNLILMCIPGYMTWFNNFLMKFGRAIKLIED